MIPSANYRRLVLLACLICPSITWAQQPAPFAWPEGKRMALSLSFDDARASQVDVGMALLDQYGVKATFYVVPSSVEGRLAGWQQAVAGGHEIGNHSLTHPCSGNFSWIQDNALETYDLQQMRTELEATSQKIEKLLGVTPTTFAYPCGQTFVGRGLETASYVPLVAELFTAGRGWLDESANDPAFCDLAQLMGQEMDGKDFDQIKLMLENARATGRWVVLAGHEVGSSGPQTTRIEMLKKLIAYAQDPAQQIWLAPVGTIAAYVAQHRAGER